MDATTRAYVAKRTALGYSKMEAIRCLKGYLAREIYYLLSLGQPQHTKPTKPEQQAA